MGGSGWGRGGKAGEKPETRPLQVRSGRESMRERRSCSSETGHHLKDIMQEQREGQGVNQGCGKLVTAGQGYAGRVRVHSHTHTHLPAEQGIKQESPKRAG
eukprot:1160105-Pelagomonas_calceolata.AAC.4